MISFANIERAAVSLNAFDDRGNHYVWVGVPVAVSVGAQVVREQETAHLDECGDGLTVISGYSRREVLRSFDAAGCTFDWQTGDGDGSAGAAGVGVEKFIAYEHPFCRTGVLQVDFLNVCRNSNRVAVLR